MSNIEGSRLKGLLIIHSNTETEVKQETLEGALRSVYQQYWENLNGYGKLIEDINPTQLCSFIITDHAIEKLVEANQMTLDDLGYLGNMLKLSLNEDVKI